MSALLCLPLDELRSIAMAEAETEVGDAAPALLVKAYAESAQRESDGYLPASLLLSLTRHRHPQRVVAALVEAGCLRQQGKGYVLARYLDANPSKAQREHQKAAERERKRKAAATPDATPEPRQASTPDSGTDSALDSGTDSGPDSGRKVEPPSLHSPLSGENSQTGETPGSDAGKPAPPGATPAESRGESTPEPRQASTPDSGRKAAPSAAKGTRPYRAELAAAFAKGVSQATKAPCSPTTKSWDLEALDAAVQTHGAGKAAAEVLGWVTSSAASYVAARRTSEVDQGKGFAPERWKAWLDAGGPLSPAPTSQRPARTQTPVQPPPEGQEPGYWAKRAKRLTPNGIVDPTQGTSE